MSQQEAEEEAKFNAWWDSLLGVNADAAAQGTEIASEYFKLDSQKKEVGAAGMAMASHLDGLMSAAFGQG